MLAVSDAPAYDFSNHALGTSTDHTFTIDNSGAQKASAVAGRGLAAPFAAKGGALPGAGGTCGAELPAGASCTVVVTFSPTAIGSANSHLAIDYNDGAANQTIAIDLKGAGTTSGFLGVSDGPTYDYGVQAPGSATDHAFTVTNTGMTPVTTIAGGSFTGPYSFKGGAFPGMGGTCTTTLAANETCTVVVTFSPVSGGLAAGSAALDYYDGVANQTASAALTGWGASAAVLSISDGATYDYLIHPLTAAIDHTFTVTNSGGVPATSLADASNLAAPFGYKGGSYPGTGGTCATTLASGASCTIVVTFTSALVGPATATLTFSYADGAAMQVATRAMTGTGASAALLTLSGGPLYDFGSFAKGTDPSAHVFTVTNTGGVAATAIADAGDLAAPFAYTGSGYPGVNGTCGNRLSAGTSCDIEVKYTPTSGTQTSTVTLGFHDGLTAQTAHVDIAGSSPASAFLVYTDGNATCDFGTQAVGASTTKVFTIKNTGDKSATGIRTGGPSIPFDFTGHVAFPGMGGTCTSGSLAIGATCTFSVTFYPMAAETSSGSLVLSYVDGSGGGSPTLVRTLSGTGT